MHLHFICDRKIFRRSYTKQRVRRKKSGAAFLACLLSIYSLHVFAQNENDSDTPSSLQQDPILSQLDPSESAINDLPEINSETLENLDKLAETLGNLGSSLSEFTNRAPTEVDGTAEKLTNEPVVAFNFVIPTFDPQTSSFVPNTGEGVTELASADLTGMGNFANLQNIQSSTAKSDSELIHLRLYQLAMAEYAHRKATLTEAEFSDQIVAGIEIEEAGLGEAKVTLIGNLVAVRSLVPSSQVVVLHIEGSTIFNQLSKEEIKYFYENFIARQNMIAGRDVLVADRELNSEFVRQYYYYRIPKMFSSNWWKQQWKSIRAKSTLGDYVMGPLWATFHFGTLNGIVILSRNLQNLPIDQIR